MLNKETNRLLRMITVPLLIVDRRGTIVFCNPALLEIVGSEEGEIIGRPLAAIAEDPGDRLHRMLALFSASGNWLPGMISLRRGDGSTFGFPCRGGVVQRSAEDKDVLVGIQFDNRQHFTDLNQRIESLNNEIRRRRQAEGRLRLASFALDHVGDAIFWVGKDSRILDVNTATCRRLGYTREELLGLSVKDVDSDFPIETWPEHWENVIDRGYVVFESHHRTKSGEIFPVELALTAFDYEGRVCHVAFARDITQRKRAEQALRESEERLRQAVNVSQIGIFDYDHRSAALYCSAEQRRVFGFGAAEPVTMEKLFGGVHEDDSAAVSEAVARGQDPGGTGLMETEFRIVVPADVERTVALRAQTFFEGDGAQRCARRTVGAVLDITARKRAEEHVKRLNRLYATLSEINQTIVRITSPQELFDAVTRIAIEFGGLSCAWVGMLEEGGSWLTTGSVFGTASGYVHDIRISADPDLPEGRGPAGIALRQGRCEIANDFLNDPRLGPWQAAAQAQGIRSMAAFPLRSAGRIVGVLDLYAGETEFFDQDVVRLMEEMAVDISFALDNFAREQRRVAVEAALRDSETRLRLAVAASHQGIYDVNVRTGERTYNAEYAVMLGYDPDGFSEDQDAFLARIHREDRAAWLAAYNGYLAGERPEYRVEFRMRTAAGDWKWILATGAAVEHDEGGRPLRFIGTHIDISERKNVEERIGLLASVFESSREAIVISDAHLNIVAVNTAFTATTGYSAEEVIGSHVRILRSGYHNNAFYDAMWEQIEQAGYWQGELWSRRKDGEIYPTLASISTVRVEGKAVSHYVNIAADITHHKEAEERIQELAYYDALTGVPNRVLLQDRARRALAVAEREGTQVALFFTDLDRFKNINDSLGHVIGDQLLQAVAERLRRIVRDTDTVSRLGGDEFLLLMSVDGAAGAARVAHKLLTAIGEPYEIGGHSLGITPSIGISMYPKDGATFDELLKNADVAMYKAKESGRDAFHFFTPEMNAGALERLMLENALRQALVEHEFTLHFQPQIDLATGTTVGIEALLRWQHPQMGTISPATFIPIAEETGLIAPIGEWVLHEACRQNRQWQKAGLPAVPIAVNLSIRQFTLGNLMDVIHAALSGAELGAQWLEVEITESVLVQDIERTLRVFNELKAKGVRIAVDDFGTGYSSLSYLKRFPLNRLKIDQSFVRDLTANRDDQAIASAVINLGQSLGLTVVAEGVETKAQLEILRALGCDEAQGYLYAKPMPAAEMEQFLRAARASSPN